ncbi:hypothetical protein [Pararcticibacter amylolyticus]|uniref:DUF4890 domain-containing protein n=1 Tax=Pararcticibacter amylolyticus TaxID=2173175 RepID=A0A2U2PK13_9SPHI|nr:hypothetical protein [Pararcticibacter amylolyticus]PWG81602.1 hypothetical protein DDR33_07160 [Pararcticibacter amylolyticus]
MRKPICTVIVLFVLILTGKEVSAQKADSVKKEMVSYYSRTLSLSEDQARQVAEVHGNYKKAVNAVLSEPGLSEEQKRVKIDILIEEKNKKLSSLLTTEQMNKVVPSTELRKSKPQKELPKTR